MKAVALALLSLQGAQEPAPAEPALAIVGARFLTMTDELVREDHTVLVRDGLVEAVGPTAEIEVPADALRIPGEGRWVIPGLVDAHTHLLGEDDLLLNLAFGVTSVLNMGGSPDVLELRERVRAGELPGPRIYAGMYVDGASPAWHHAGNPEQAARLVRESRELGWDFIKTYNSLSTASFEAIMDEAHALGIPVMGHAVREPGLEHVLFTGYAAIAHAEEYLYGYLPRPLDEADIPGAVEMTLEAGTAVIATLSTYDVINEQWGERGPAFLERTLARPEAAWLRPELRDGWIAARTYAGRRGSLDANLLFLRKLVGALHEAGVPVLAGTDAPGTGIVGTYPGVLLRAELRQLERSGFSTWSALAAATAVPGRFARLQFGGTPFGTIAPGAAADLVLLGADPLEDLEHLARVEGVVVRGRHLSGAWLRASLDALAARYAEQSAQGKGTPR